MPYDKKNIHIYPEYTGTAYIMLFKPEENNDPNFIYEKVKTTFLKKFHISWSLPLGFENTYILAVRKRDKRFKNIYQNSQIQNLSDSLVIGMDHEFLERKDGFSHFSNKYQLSFKKENVISMNQGLMYSALKNKELDIIVAYSTDGRIKKFHLKTLEDDQDFFPVYEAAYIVHTPFLNKFPQIKKAFRALEGKINETEMANLNRQVDLLKYDISTVAYQFLIDKNILRHNQSIHLKNLNLKNFYLSKIDYFIKIFIEHLILVFTALFLALLVSFPIGIGAVYNQTLERITFTIINTLQTVPSLALLALLIPVFGIGFMPAIIALFIYSLLPMVRNIYEGIKKH